MTDATDHLADTRVSYTAGTLLEADLAPAPLEQFRRWYADAEAAASRGILTEANAMTCATVGPDGAPQVRTVLLKGVDRAGFRFFTNLASRKGLALAREPRVALLLAWVPLQRQVSILGRATALDRDEVAAYFRSRPYGSRIGAIASLQSRVASSREQVDAAAEDLVRRHPDTGSPDDVPVPQGWGGFVVAAHEVEFWQGRPSRLHDRLVYVGGPALDDPSAWRVERRWP